MSVERIEIDSDEFGWLVAFDGDLTDAVENYLSGRIDTRLILRLPNDQAVALMEQVKQKIRPWHVEGESVRHDHERYRRTGELPDYVSEDRPDWCPPTPGRQEGDASTSPSDLADRADYERKRERENR